MRVISGRLKGYKLKQVPGDSTRPLTDRVKENLFNILGDWVSGTHWLDLFAGTGQVGIEALSRGASSVVYVDTTPEAIRTINSNLQHTGLTKMSTVIRQDAFHFLEKTAYRPFDVVYVAPPQYRGLWADVLSWIDENLELILIEDGLIIVQIDPVEFRDLSLQKLVLDDQRKYGRTMLCFYQPAEINST